MWDLAVREKDYQAVDSMLSRYRGRVPISYRLVPARGRNDAPGVTDLLAEARTLESRQLQLAARYSAAYLDDLQFADSITRLDFAWRTRPINRTHAQLLLGWIALAQGRWPDAFREFEQAEGMEGAGAVATHMAAAATLPFLDPPRGDLEAIRARLERSRPGLTGPGQGNDPGSVLQPHLRFQLLALVASRLDDSEAVAAYRDSLLASPTPQELADVARMMVATVDADQAFRLGEHRRVLEILDQPTPAIPLELIALPRPAHLREFGFEHARFLRGVSAAVLGDDGEASRWLQYGLALSPQELAYRAPIHLEMARLHERRSDNVRARERYEAAVRLWGNAGPPLQSRVDSARQRLQELAGANPK